MFRSSKKIIDSTDSHDTKPIPSETIPKIVPTGKKVMFGGGGVGGVVGKKDEEKENGIGKKDQKILNTKGGGQNLSTKGNAETASKATTSKKNEVPLSASRNSAGKDKDQSNRQRTKSTQPDRKNESPEKHSRSKSDLGSSLKSGPSSVSMEKQSEKDEKKGKTIKHSQETIITRPDESRIPTSHSKKPAAADSTKRIEHTLQQMGTLKTRLRQELKTRSSTKKPSEELNMDNINFQDEGAIRDTLLELHRNNVLLKKQVTELNSHNSTLQNRLLKDQEKAKLHPKVTSVVPTSLEANIHLRYQFQKNLEKERKKYTQLLLENERLALEVKEANLENLKKRKTRAMETSISHNAEISNWKAKVRELELDNLQLLEIITKREQELSKVVKEKQYIYNEMVTMRRLHMHLSNRIDNMAATDSTPNSNIGSQELKDEDSQVITGESAPSTEANLTIPHYAQKIKRENEMKIRAGNKRLLAASKTTTVKKMTQIKLAESFNNQTTSEVRSGAPESKRYPQQIPYKTIDEEEQRNTTEESKSALNVKKTASGKKITEPSVTESDPELQINGEIKPVKRAKAKSETPSKAAEDESEKENKRDRASSNTKQKTMNNAKIQLEYESYIGSD